MTDSWRDGDPLGTTLHFLRMSGVFYCRSEFTAPWGLELPPFQACLMFHVVTAGQCWLEVAGDAACLLRPGDLVLVPHGEGHRLVSEPGHPAEPLFNLPREPVSDSYEILRHGGAGPATTVICGVVRFEHPAAHHLIGLLPRLIRIDTWSAPEGDWVQSTLRFMVAEARESRAGGGEIITRLADIVVIQAIRSWIARDPSDGRGWIAALRDPHIGRAIALIHRDTARRWTLGSLATEVGMSRSAFAERFTQLVGEAAMQYVTRWKMSTALMWLKERDASVSELASRLGYESEAAFARAFKRHIGVSPGAARWNRAALPGGAPDVAGGSSAKRADPRTHRA